FTASSLNSRVYFFLVFFIEHLLVDYKSTLRKVSINSLPGQSQPEILLKCQHSGHHHPKNPAKNHYISLITPYITVNCWLLPHRRSASSGYPPRRWKDSAGIVPMLMNGQVTVA
ncbi:MAG: hypothetical protein ACYDBT_08155, partial [Desulfobulbaceae bacterium]